MAKMSASFQNLPNELLSEILLHLNTLRTTKTQAAALKEEDTENRRQQENRSRQIGLYGLCLTSHQFNQIATSILYASFTGSTTWYGIKPLRLFCNTVAGTHSPNRKKYAGYIQYVENRLIDYLGHNMLEDAEHPGGPDMLVEYFSLLAEVVNSAPNLHHISVVSLEQDKISFWRHIVHEQQDAAKPSSTFVAEHGLRNLEVLSVQTNTMVYLTKPQSFFQGICAAVASLPSLSDFRFSRLEWNFQLQPPANIGHFKTLQRLEITECVLKIHAVTELLLACKSLRHFTCKWEPIYCVRETPSDLRPGLLHHSHTLETLHLDFRKTRWDFYHTPFKEIGSFRQMERLEALTISKMGFTRGDWFSHPDDAREKLREVNLANWLPTGLKKFNLLLDKADFELDPDISDNVPELQVLSGSCKSSTLELEEVTVICTCEVRGVKERTDDFSQAGVLLKVIIDP